MKKILITLFAFCLTQKTFAQEYPLEVATDSFQIELKFENGQFNLISEEIKTAPGKILKVEKVRLEDAAIVVTYFAGGVKTDFSYLIGLEILDEKNRLFLPERHQTGGVIYEKGKRKKDLAFQKVLWQDVLEGTIFPDKKYTLIVKKTLLGKVDCAAGRPTFKRRHFVEHTSATAVGVGLLGAALIFNNQKNKNYEQYENLWQEGVNGEFAQPFYDDAKTAHSRARWTSILGTAILLADGGIYYFVRRKKLKKQQGIYDQFCVKQKGNDLSFLIPEPIYSPDSKGSVALKWKVSF